MKNPSNSEIYKKITLNFQKIIKNYLLNIKLSLKNIYFLNLDIISTQ